jgi:hypothetical protein
VVARENGSWLVVAILVVAILVVAILVVAILMSISHALAPASDPPASFPAGPRYAATSRVVFRPCGFGVPAVLAHQGQG